MYRQGPLESGERDYRVRLEQRPIADEVDDAGAPTDVTADVPWTVLVESMPAAKFDLSGRERFMADQMSAPYDCRWDINYRADMDPDTIDVPKRRRIVHQSRIYDITAAFLIGRRDGIALLTLASSRIPA